MAKTNTFGTVARRLRALPKKALLASPRAVRHALGPEWFEAVTPEFLWFEATSACGNRCQFCSIGAQVPTYSPMSANRLEATLKDPLFRDLRIVVVSGGEPTLRPDLEAILLGVHRALPKARIVLSTSAALPERLVDVVKSALGQGIRLEVGVSVDGIGKDHDRMRGIEGLFAKTDQAVRELARLKRLHGSRFKLSIGMVICDDTLSHVEEVQSYAKEHGAEFNPQWYNQAKYYGNVGQDRLADTGALLRLAKKLEPTLLNEFAKRWLQGKAPKARCTMMFNACLLKSSGELVTCFAKWDLSAGNVLQNSPSEIWASAKAQAARREVMACEGCLNTCGVVWSYDANYLGRSRFFLRHPRVLLAKLRERVAG
jgi:MoaA/NifB/PqqE/SkfB family radical SAM enzyme